MHFKVRLTWAINCNVHNFSLFVSDITWTTHSTLRRNRVCHGSAILNSTLYMLGGMWDSSETTEKMNIATGQWSDGLSLKSRLVASCIVAISQMEFITLTLEGQMFLYNVETGTVEEYDPAPIQVQHFIMVEKKSYIKLSHIRCLNIKKITLELLELTNSPCTQVSEEKTYRLNLVFDDSTKLIYNYAGTYIKT